MEIELISLHDAMEQISKEKTEKATGGLESAKAHYEAALATARKEAGLTNTPTCVPCSYCGAQIDEPCMTKKGKGKPTTPHGDRNYAYEDAVRSVHYSGVVRASKDRVDGYQKMLYEAKYTGGTHTQNVKFPARAAKLGPVTTYLAPPLPALWIVQDGPYERYLYQALWSKNVFGINRMTRFHISELMFMLKRGVDIYDVEERMVKAVQRFIEPEEDRQARARETQQQENRQRKRDLTQEFLDIAGLSLTPYGLAGGNTPDHVLQAGIAAMKAVKGREEL